MNDIFEKFITWFNGLNESAQIDAIIVNSIDSLLTWLRDLGLNQQLVVLAIAVVLIMLISFLLWVINKSIFRIKKWYRRKRIPKDINLHLDAEN